MTQEEVKQIRFKVGDKVVPNPDQHSGVVLTNGVVYTVESLKNYDGDCQGIILKEMPDSWHYSYRFKLAYTDGMNFKIGDFVSPIMGNFAEEELSPPPGEHEVVGFDTNRKVLYLKNVTGGFSQDNFKLIPLPLRKDKIYLEALIKKVNEGFTARAELGKILAKGDLEYREKEGRPWRRAADLSTREYRVKEEPKMAPWKTSCSKRWEISVIGNEVHIGCKTLSLDGVRNVLYSFFKMDAQASRSYGVDAYATWKGIKVGDHVLTWADAQKLYTELGKIK